MLGKYLNEFIIVIKTNKKINNLDLQANIFLILLISLNIGNINNVPYNRIICVNPIKNDQNISYRRPSFSY